LKDIAKNPLYANITLDPRNVELYPDDDTLPGLDQYVVHDTESDVKSIFDQETAGVNDHPALNLNTKDVANDESVIFLEKMGVADPESVKIQGCTFTSSASHNMIHNPSDCPDS
jgi:hypothetical protein